MQDRLDSQTLDQDAIDKAIDDHKRERLPAMDRFWSYFRNQSEPVPSAGLGAKRRRLAQEAGLPARLTGRDPLLDDRARREIVIENDIAWRVQTMIDFLFGKPVRVVSTARDTALREKIDALLDAIWEHSGGVALLQDMALLGHVFGHVDLALRLDESDLILFGAIARGDADASDLIEIARAIRVDVIEPRRGIPLLDESDYRRLRGYVIHFEPGGSSRAERTRRWLFAGREARASSEKARGFTEIITGDGRRIEIDGETIEQSPARLLDGELPIVHMQNISQPFRFEGLGEVEPLMPLQDELNTRLSDRASRVTMQTFKMYLARGIDGFDATAVGPGQIWATDNLDASIESFGGDADSPSEDAHIGELREAMDKISGVPPVASGVVRARIGNLSSANALRITLMGLLSKNARKRVTYGRGIERMSEMALQAIDAAGVLAIDARDRGVRLVWPDPLPTDIEGEIRAAKGKVELGVEEQRVLGELGYAPSDAGVV